MMAPPEGDLELQDLYQEVLLDYYRDATRKGKLDAPDLCAHGINPVCGDELELTVAVDKGTLAKIRYQGHGCVISQSSAAVMAESLEGATPEKARELATAFKDMLMSRRTAASLPAELEAAGAMEGVRRFPLRVKCATLGWNTLMSVLKEGGGAETSAGEFKEV